MPSRQEAAWGNLAEIPNQIRYIRQNNRIQGSIFFSSKSLTTVAKQVADSLKTDLYKYPALPPQMPWLDDVVPNEPQAFTADAMTDGINLKWVRPLKANDGETASGYVIYRAEEGDKINILNPKYILRISFQDFTFYLDTNVEKGKRYTYLITALDRLKNESEASGPVGVQAK